MGAEERPPEEPSAEAIGLGTTSPTFAHDGPEAEPAATTAAAGGDATRRTRGRTGTKRSRRRRQRSPLPDRWRRHGAAPARGGSTDFTTHAAPSQRRPTRPSGQRRAAVRPGLVRDRRHEGGPAHLSRSDLVRLRGLEPRTCGLRVRCSAIELEAHREVYAKVDVPPPARTSQGRRSKEASTRSAPQNPSAPSPTASTGAGAAPRQLASAAAWQMHFLVLSPGPGPTRPRARGLATTARGEPRRLAIVLAVLESAAEQTFV